MHLNVVTINFNNLTGLKKTIESVIHQRKENHTIKFIVIDGESRDGSAQYLLDNKEYIDVLIIEKDNGIYDAMNKSIKYCLNGYIIFMNSGDTFYSNLTTKYLAESNLRADLVLGSASYINIFGNLSLWIPKSLSKSFFGIPTCHQSILCKTDILINRPFLYEYYRLAGDADFLMYCDSEGFSEQLIPEIIIASIEPGGQSNSEGLRSLKELYKA